MRCPPVLAALPALLLLTAAGCGSQDPGMPAACTSTPADGYERALAVAPRAVRLPGGTPISVCLHRVRSDADLQNLGAILHPLADRLAGRVREDRDAGAARQLGYLAAAVSAGAAESNGISAELARRIATTGAGLAALSPTVERALREGEAAGRATG